MCQKKDLSQEDSGIEWNDIDLCLPHIYVSLIYTAFYLVAIYSAKTLLNTLVTIPLNFICLRPNPALSLQFFPGNVDETNPTHKVALMLFKVLSRLTL